ncbi:MAG: ABC-F family ATP-binding cassette domain-containing protein [Lachnospiraceae bacterium]|nr:ABC-F family ATP-binding cassette domain-containing protein [Lachnospiraceae bacterium]
MSNKELIRAKGIEFSYGDQVVLSFEDFYLYEGDKVGLVGVNGVGKTTLLKLLMGEIAPDKGKVIRNCEPFYFKQFDHEPDPFDIDFGEAGQLKIQDKIWQGNVSGGENTRLCLAQLFSSERAVAFIDEPTANLDGKGRELLVNRLKDIESMILICHDRDVCNKLCNRIVELSAGQLTSYDGNYDAYLAQKEIEKKKQQAEYEQYVDEKARLQAVVSQKKEKAAQVQKKPTDISSSDAKARAYIANRKPESKAKALDRAANNVQKRIDHMEIKEKPKSDAVIKLDFRLTNPPRNAIVIRVEDLTFAYDDIPVLEHCDLVVKNGSKLALLGDNGAGKTTLLNLIMERERVSVVPTAKIGYLRQNFSQIDLEKTVMENISRVSIQKESVARMILARLLLTARDLQKLGKDLSGGERMKLAFAMLLVSDVNVLIMDEPTNYLDIASIEALENLLSEYEGTVLFTSHDKAFVDHVATDRYLIERGKTVPVY